jgi:hypothetical protein
MECEQTNRDTREGVKEVDLFFVEYNDERKAV